MGVDRTEGSQLVTESEQLDALWVAAEELARSIGHHTVCNCKGCTCGTAAKQAEALTKYERLKGEQVNDR
jgi:hypothetical protein